MTDAEANQVQVRISTLKTQRAIRDRKRRPLSGVAVCADCGKKLVYIQKGKGTEYLRCGQLECPSRHKMIRSDWLFEVLQYSLAMHAKAVAPLLGQPKVEPPEVAALRQEIQMLQKITGTEAVIRAKEDEIQRLQGEDSDTPLQVLITALKLPQFWLRTMSR